MATSSRLPPHLRRRKPLRATGRPKLCSSSEFTETSLRSSPARSATVHDSTPDLSFSSPVSSYSFLPSSSPPMSTPPDSPVIAHHKIKAERIEEDTQGLLLLLTALESREAEVLSNKCSGNEISAPSNAAGTSADVFSTPPAPHGPIPTVLVKCEEEISSPDVLEMAIRHTPTYQLPQIIPLPDPNPPPAHAETSLDENNVVPRPVSLSPSPAPSPSTLPSQHQASSSPQPNLTPRTPVPQSPLEHSPKLLPLDPPSTPDVILTETKSIVRAAQLGVFNLDGEKEHVIVDDQIEPSPSSPELPRTKVSRKRKRVIRAEVVDTERSDLVASSSSSQSGSSGSSAEDAKLTPPPKRRRGPKKRTAKPVIPSPVDISSIILSDEAKSELISFLVDSLVFSPKRVSSQTAPDLFITLFESNSKLISHHPSYSPAEWLGLMRMVLSSCPAFSHTARSGTDADGEKLEDLWWYDADSDPDQSRASTMRGVGRGKRRATMADRRYYWEPIDMNRWAIAAEEED